MLAKYSLFCTKESRKQTKRERSQIQLKDESGKTIITFYLQHATSGMKDDPEKKYPEGQMSSKVKAGYLDEKSSDPKYAIKAYRNNVYPQNNETHIHRAALVGAHCYQLLGNQAYVYTNNHKLFLIMDWIAGPDLYYMHPENIIKFPIPERIEMGVNLIKQVEVLHTAGYIHRDLKLENIMWNRGDLKLIDLDSCRVLNYECPYVPWASSFTPRFLPQANSICFKVYKKNQLNLLDEKTDVYGLGCVLMYLFSDIYVQQYNKVEYTDRLSEGNVVYSLESIRFKKGIHFDKYVDLRNLLCKMVTYDINHYLSAKYYIDAFIGLLAVYSNIPHTPRPIRSYPLENFSRDDGLKLFKAIDKKLLKYEEDTKNNNNNNNNLEEDLKLLVI